jgi:hypothetical protein
VVSGLELLIELRVSDFYVFSCCTINHSVTVFLALGLYQVLSQPSIRQFAYFMITFYRPPEFIKEDFAVRTELHEASRGSKMVSQTQVLMSLLIWVFVEKF